MDIQHLTKMANNIASFFDAEADKAKAAKGVADHIRSFWEPRMIREIYQHIDARSGVGLDSLALSALRSHRGELLKTSESRG